MNDRPDGLLGKRSHANREMAEIQHSADRAGRKSFAETHSQATGGSDVESGEVSAKDRREAGKYELFLCVGALVRKLNLLSEDN